MWKHQCGMLCAVESGLPKGINFVSYLLIPILVLKDIYHPEDAIFQGGLIIIEQIAYAG